MTDAPHQLGETEDEARDQLFEIGYEHFESVDPEDLLMPSNKHLLEEEHRQAFSQYAEIVSAVRDQKEEIGASIEQFYKKTGADEQIQQHNIIDYPLFYSYQEGCWAALNENLDNGEDETDILR